MFVWHILIRSSDGILLQLENISAPFKNPYLYILYLEPVWMWNEAFCARLLSLTFPESLDRRSPETQELLDSLCPDWLVSVITEVLICLMTCVPKRVNVGGSLKTSTFLSAGFQSLDWHSILVQTFCVQSGFWTLPAHGFVQKTVQLLFTHDV